MKPHVLVATLGACCTVLAVTGSRTSAVSQAPVQKAVATVEPMLGQSRVLVHVTNNASLAVEAWQLQVDYQLVSGTRGTVYVTTDTCFDSAPAGTLGAGAIPSQETRDETVPLPDAALSTSVTVRMLLFEDLSFEGSSEEVNFLLAKRARHVATLATWINALQGVAGKKDAEGRAVLRNALASERLRADQLDSRDAATLDQIAQFLETSRADAKFSDQITALRQRLEKERARAVKRQAR